MKKDPVIYLNHILNSIILIQEYTNGMDEGKFLHNQLVEDACIRNFEIIGCIFPSARPLYSGPLTRCG